MALPDSLRGLASGSFDFARQRLELATLDVEEQALRGGRMLALLLAGVALGTLGIAGLAATIVVWLWDTSRLAALLGVTGVLLLAAAVVLRALWLAVTHRPALLAATLEELQRDSDHLAGRS
jgi:uncharacterized membrane protein YqjE